MMATTQTHDTYRIPTQSQGKLVSRCCMDSFVILSKALIEDPTVPKLGVNIRSTSLFTYVLLTLLIVNADDGMKLYVGSETKCWL